MMAWKEWHGNPPKQYWVMWHKGRQMFQHRHIMEVEIGRALGAKEFIHHKDGDGLNNSLSNLQIVSCKEHHKLHGNYGRERIVPKNEIGLMFWMKHIGFTYKKWKSYFLMVILQYGVMLAERGEYALLCKMCYVRSKTWNQF